MPVKNRYIFYFLTTLLLVSQLSSQENYSNSGPELIYIHTDRSTYFIGEDLWYKAYTVDVYNRMLSNQSNVLYVELISADKKIVARNITNLEMGLGHGDFKFPEPSGIKAGKYTLRAYTNWNRNYVDDFVFTKKIEIVNLFQPANQVQQPITPSLEQPNSDLKDPLSFKIDFFPEGGSLIENVASVIGFKAIDDDGQPVVVNGEIFNGKREKITTFSSAHQGMGQFQLFPIKGETYYARVKSVLGEIQQALPESLKEGFTLCYKTQNEKKYINISTNQATLLKNTNKEFKVVLKSKGISYLEIRKTISDLSSSFVLPEEKLKPGVTQATLYDNQSIPHSERLIYIDNEDHFQVKLELEKPVYKPGEKVTINVIQKSKIDSTQAASYSVSAFDLAVAEDESSNTSISSHFFLESEIRGHFHNPAYYFDRTNPDRLQYLDNLLLTQGWRNFIWRKPVKKDSISFNAEKGFSVSGKLKRVFGEKALVNSSITLGLVNKHGFKAISTKTDSLGNYIFKDLVFFGNTTLYLSATNEKGKPHGYLLLDPLDQKSMPVTIKNTSAISLSSQTLTENFLKKFKWLGVKPENILNEVVITTKKREEPSTLYRAVDYTYVADDKTKDLPTIYDVLSEVPGVVVVDRTAFIPGEKDDPLILIDNYANSAALNFIDPIEVIKIEVIRFSEILLPIFGEESRGGIIAITTNGKSRMNQPKKIPVHSINKKTEGYYESRDFYTQIVNNTNTEEKKHLAAIRNTIFWSPYVTPSKGKAKIEFYTTNVETQVKVILEGITSNGIPVTTQAYYSVME